MNSIVLKGNLRGRTHLMPASWEEVTPRQWRQWVRWQQAGAEEGERMALLCLWSGITLRDLLVLSDHQLLALLDLMKWVEQPPIRWMARPRLFAAPGDGLEHLTFGQYMQAETAFGRLVAGDAAARPALLEALHQPHIPALRYWCDELTAYSHVLNYTGARTELPRVFTALFNQSEGEGSTSDSTWFDVGLNLARKTTALGTYAQLEQTNVYLVLTALTQIVAEYRQQEKALKK